MGFCDYVGCHEKTVLGCGRCKSSHYCTREHQREAWKIHKKVCGHLTTTAKCASCSLMVGKARDNAIINAKKPVFLHFTNELIPIILSSADAVFGSMLHRPMEPLADFVIVVSHKDPASEAFKKQFKMLFTKPDAEVNFLFLENGEVTLRTSTSEWAEDIPKSLLNLFDENKCVVCFECVDLSDAFMCRDCGNSVCHSDLSNIILSEGLPAIRNELQSTGFVSLRCPVCRRKKSLQSERWDISKRTLVQDGVGVIAGPFAALVVAMRKAAKLE